MPRIDRTDKPRVIATRNGKPAWVDAPPRLRSDAFWFAVCCLFMAGLWIATPGDASDEARAFAFQAEPVPVSSADAASIAFAGDTK